MGEDLKEVMNFMVINVSKQDDIDKAKTIIANKGLSDIAYYDVKGEFAKYFGVIGVPAAYRLDDQGLIEEIYFGSVISDDIIKKIMD